MGLFLHEPNKHCDQSLNKFAIQMCTLYYKAQDSSVTFNQFYLFPLFLQIYEFLGHLNLSYAAAFVASLAFESPMMGLEKVIFKRQEKSKK